MENVGIFESDSFLHRDEPSLKSWLCMDRTSLYDDNTIGVCLHSLGIDPINTLDREYRERFSLFSEKLHRKMSRESDPDMWYWKLKPFELKDGKNCCSPNAITFHDYKHQDADEFERLHLKYNVEEGVGGKVFEVPQPPQRFLHSPLNFSIDEWRNSLSSKATEQLVYMGPGKERVCWKCKERD